jgi:hypothetical protein
MMLKSENSLDNFQDLNKTIVAKESAKKFLCGRGRERESGGRAEGQKGRVLIASAAAN